jgi:hypothetical protein
MPRLGCTLPERWARQLPSWLVMFCVLYQLRWRSGVNEILLPLGFRVSYYSKSIVIGGKMSRLVRISIILILFLSFVNHQQVSSTTLVSPDDLSPQGTGRFVVFEGFMRAT